MDGTPAPNSPPQSRLRELTRPPNLQAAGLQLATGDALFTGEFALPPPTTPPPPTSRQSPAAAEGSPRRRKRPAGAPPAAASGTTSARPAATTAPLRPAAPPAARSGRGPSATEPRTLVNVRGHLVRCSHNPHNAINPQCGLFCEGIKNGRTFPQRPAPRPRSSWNTSKSTCSAAPRRSGPTSRSSPARSASSSAAARPTLPPPPPSSGPPSPSAARAGRPRRHRCNAVARVDRQSRSRQIELPPNSPSRRKV